MIISELIAKLEELKAEHGDLSAMIWHRGRGCNFNIEEVFLDPGDTRADLFVSLRPERVSWGGL